MTREEELDWLYRLRSEIYVYMPKEWLIPMNNALDMAIKALEQEPFINKPCVSSEVCEHDKNIVLDKIRADIEHLKIVEGGDDYVRKMAELFSLKVKVLQIIDKYKAETEKTDGTNKQA